MRRFVTITAVSCGLLLAVAPRASAEAYAGFRAGVNLASFTGSDADEFSGSRTGFAGGGFIGFDSGKYVGARADLMYTMKGATEGEATIKIDYIELGTLLVGRLALADRFSVRAFAGPVVGVFINAEGDNGPNDIDFGDYAEHWEVSGTVGVELDVKTGPYSLLLETRYTTGTRVFESDGPIDLDVSNAGIGVMAGVMVPF